jgi:S1-C subfamily serine protease
VAFGPHRAADATADGRLWLPPIAGETALIELFWPAPLRTLRPVVQLTTVARGYRPAWGSPQAVEHSGAGAAGDCNVDVGCPLGDEWQDEKRGVVQLLIAGSRLCSGSLVNTTARDCRPYVLTAAHCLKQSTDAAATLFRFGYERPLCENGDAPTGSVLYGATLRATHPASDFALLELDQLPPAAFDAYYAGWNRATTPPAESWCVHHAGGGPKKISHDANAAVSGSSTGWGTSHWRVQDWEDGTTAPGSSGAPLLDPKGRIVGQLHGGTADCAGGWDEFGKLAHSWGGGGSSGSRLSDWLDPLGSGALAIDGLDGSACRREVGSAAPRPRPLVHGREVRASRRPAPR